MPDPETARLRQDVFHAAAHYHAAVARYARALAGGRALESAAQEVVQTSLRYHVALDACLQQPEPDPRVASRQRLYHLRRQLEAASRQYDALRRSGRRTNGGIGAGW